MRRWLRLLACGSMLATAACAGSESSRDDDGNGAGGGAFELASSPEFVNRLIPGRRPLALVTTSEESGAGPIELSGTVSPAIASVEIGPPSIEPGEVAEVWVDVPEVMTDTPVSVTVTGLRGNDQSAVSIDATAVPGSDDLEPTALDIADIFLGEMAGEVEGLPADRSGLVNGTPVAGLLVVSHYAWFLDDYEIGLAWHVMVAPDDWADLYVRPRDELTPVHALRLSSWSTALAGGEHTITSVPAPAEVTR